MVSQNNFCELFWLTPTEVVDKCKHEGSAKEDLPKLIKLYSLYEPNHFRLGKDTVRP